ncbi:MAG TPA: DinB family protein [Gemmatimonadaceae bacterium]|jgi:uncharacterized damage-inducible protein DinB|nr:DinB family protein [Gemmatimonadaceae bacterium]
MRSPVRSIVLQAAFAVACALPAAAQAGPQAGSLSADLLADVADVEKKLVDLARAIPAEKYDWRPGTGVRSVNDVVLHVAADNYLIPAALGFTPDAATGIKGDDYKTAMAFEQRKMSKDAAIAELEKSFAFLKQSLQSTTPAKMGDQVKLFGQPFTMQRAWILGTTHLHEHLGQLIAYARTNGVKPPWSR